MREGAGCEAGRRETDMGGYDTSDLHHRQLDGATGNAILASPSATRRWRPLAVPVGIALVGLILSMWGPLPGLGVVLLIGGVSGLAITVPLALLGGFD